MAQAYFKAKKRGGHKVPSAASLGSRMKQGKGKGSGGTKSLGRRMKQGGR